MSLFGGYEISIEQEHSYKLYKHIKSNRLPIQNISEKNGRVTFYSPAEAKAGIDEIGIPYEIISVKGLVKYLHMLLSKKGMLAGAAVSILLIAFFSRYILSFEILCSNAELNEKIMSVLSANGVTTGNKISDINFTVAERELKSSIDELSWVGITVEGSKVIIDVIENVDKPEYTKKRLPSNLISVENGIIDKVELVDGQLLKPVGSGITKGDTIVTGKIDKEEVYYKKGEEIHEHTTRYTRSIGTVYGTFERTITFEQPFTASKKLLSDNTDTRYTLSIFDTVLPLYFDSSDNFTLIDEKKHTVSFWGIEIPVSVTETDVSRYSYIAVPISKSDAEVLAKQQADLYEKNFLSDFEIKNAEYSYSYNENGVILTASYSLYGIISKEVDFFIKK